MRLGYFLRTKIDRFSLSYLSPILKPGTLYLYIRVSFYKRLAITLENVIPTNVIGRLFLVSWANTSRLVARYCSGPGYD